MARRDAASQQQILSKCRCRTIMIKHHKHGELIVAVTRARPLILRCWFLQCVRRVPTDNHRPGYDSVMLRLLIRHHSPRRVHVPSSLGASEMMRPELSSLASAGSVPPSGLSTVVSGRPPDPARRCQAGLSFSVTVCTLWASVQQPVPVGCAAAALQERVRYGGSPASSKPSSASRTAAGFDRV